MYVYIYTVFDPWKRGLKTTNTTLGEIITATLYRQATSWLEPNHIFSSLM